MVRLVQSSPALRFWKSTLWSSRSRKLYVLTIVCYAAVLVPYTLLYDATRYELTQLAAITTCAAALMLGVQGRNELQKPWDRLDLGPATKLFVTGGVGAFFVETEYVIWEHAIGATGASASPNLAVDLLETMPWYLLLLLFLGVALKRTRITVFQMLLLGGVYELMPDGLLGAFIGGTLPSTLPFLLLLVPIFTLVYSPIVALPFLLVKKSYQDLWSRNPPRGSRLWLLFPCAAIFIYGPFYIALLILR